MTHTYSITGMTCIGCEAKVKGLLSQTKGVKSVRINLSAGLADIEMDQHVSTSTLASALQDYPKYHLSEAESIQLPIITESSEAAPWLVTYKPILLIFAYTSVVSILTSISGNHFHAMHAMRIFMSGFFLVFSFFKLLGLKAFAESYAMYDIVAKQFKQWGFIYAFIELSLGIAYALNFNPLITNIVTLVIMGASIIGVLQSVFNKKKIRCACLGAVFNLPMSTVTIIEDALMIAMSAAMLLLTYR